MPAVESMDRPHDALLFLATGKDRYGKILVSITPVELRVRWNDKQRRVLDRQGNTIAVDATAIVDRDIPLGSILWRGGIDDLPGTSPIPTSGLMEVKLSNSVDDLKGRVTRYDVAMIRATDTLPTS